VPSESMWVIVSRSAETSKTVNAALPSDNELALFGHSAPSGQSPSQYAILIAPFGTLQGPATERNLVWRGRQPSGICMEGPATEWDLVSNLEVDISIQISYSQTDLYYECAPNGIPKSWQHWQHWWY